jgi:hypothetical protein
LPMVHHSRQTLEVQLTEVSCYQNGVSWWNHGIC